MEIPKTTSDQKDQARCIAIMDALYDFAENGTSVPEHAQLLDIAAEYCEHNYVQPRPDLMADGVEVCECIECGTHFYFDPKSV